MFVIHLFVFLFCSGAAKNWKWAAGGSSILSEIGSFHLEFQYLTKITNNPIYFDKVHIYNNYYYSTTIRYYCTSLGTPRPITDGC